LSASYTVNIREGILAQITVDRFTSGATHTPACDCAPINVWLTTYSSTLPAIAPALLDPNIDLTDPSKYTIKVQGSEQDKKGVHTFYLVAQYPGNYVPAGYYQWSSQVTLNVVCDSLSTNVSRDSYPTGYGHSQEVDVNDNTAVSAHLTRFVTRNVTSSNQYCAIDYVSGILITDSSGSPSTELTYSFDNVNN
jgi:hypothetical protein